MASLGAASSLLLCFGYLFISSKEGAEDFLLASFSGFYGILKVGKTTEVILFPLEFQPCPVSAGFPIQIYAADAAQVMGRARAVLDFGYLRSGFKTGICPGLLSGINTGTGLAHTDIRIGQGIGGFVSDSTAFAQAFPKPDLPFPSGTKLIGTLQYGQFADFPAGQVILMLAAAAHGRTAFQVASHYDFFCSAITSADPPAMSFCSRGRLTDHGKHSELLPDQAWPFTHRHSSVGVSANT